MRLSCHDFKDNVVRLALFVLAYNLGNFLGRLVMHARRFVFQMAEVSLTKGMLGQILKRIHQLEPSSG